mgnify:CR=1 FL=1
MRDSLKELDNNELISVYYLVLEHLEFLENEKNKMMEEEDERVITK